MAVSSVSDIITAYGTNDKKPTTTSNSTLSMEDFYSLMAAQLKYQDMDNPADTSQMMQTMVQSQMIQAITNMAATNTTTYAASMVGKEVTVAEVDSKGFYKGDKEGVVTGVVLGDDPLVLIDGKSYSLSQIVAIGDVPSTNAPDNKNDGSEDNKTGGSDDSSTNGSSGTENVTG